MFNFIIAREPMQAKVLRLTYSFHNWFVFANTFSGRDLKAFEDKFL